MRWETVGSSIWIMSQGTYLAASHLRTTRATGIQFTAALGSARYSYHRYSEGGNGFGLLRQQERGSVLGVSIVLPV